MLSVAWATIEAANRCRRSNTAANTTPVTLSAKNRNGSACMSPKNAPDTSAAHQNRIRRRSPPKTNPRKKTSSHTGANTVAKIMLGISHASPKAST